MTNQQILFICMTVFALVGWLVADHFYGKYTKLKRIVCEHNRKVILDATINHLIAWNKQR